MRLVWMVLLAAGLGWSGYAEQRVINGIAVIVNDAIITYQEVEGMVKPTLEQLERQLDGQPQLLRERRARLLRDATELLVERQLILHDFRTAGYKLPESLLEDNVRERIKQRFGDRIVLVKTLKAEGINFETFRQRVRDDFILEQMRYYHVSKELIISPQKIADYYRANQTNYTVADQVKLRMIVLNKPAGSDNGATKELAREIAGKIKDGAAFEEMARIHSEGSQRAEGGDWGWVERSVLRKELVEVAFGSKPGVCSDVIDLPEACFIMLVEDIRSAHVRPLVEVRDDIEKNLIVQERARLQQKWIDRLKAKSFIRYY